MRVFIMVVAAFLMGWSGCALWERCQKVGYPACLYNDRAALSALESEASR